MKFDKVLQLLDVPHTKGSAWYEDREKRFMELFHESAKKHMDNRNTVFRLCRNFTDDYILYNESDFIDLCPELLDVIELICTIENHFNTNLNDTELDESYENTFRTVEDFVIWIADRL